MRAAWLRAAILGLLIGPAPLVVEAADTDAPDVDRVEAEQVEPGKLSGHAVRGVHFYVWDEDRREAAQWALELAASAAETTDPAHWRSIATRTAALPAVSVSEREMDFATHGEDPVGDSGISLLGFVLCLLPSLDRTCLISSWATSPDEHTRRALARALSAPFEAVGVLGAIEHLQHDPSAEVRRLASSAAAARRTSLG